MGASVDYLQRDNKTKRLSFRRVFPSELRPYLPKGMTELKRSLGSKDIQDPRAAAKFAEASGEYERLHALALKQSSGSFDTLDGPRIAWIAETYKAALVAEDENRRLSGNRKDPEYHLNTDDGLKDIYADASPKQVAQYFEDDAQQIAMSQGWRLDRSSADFTKLCYALLNAAIQANNISIGRDQGHPLETPESPAPASLTSSLDWPKASTSESFQEIAEAVLSNPRLDNGRQMVTASRPALRSFFEVHGQGMRPEAITRRHAAMWLDMLAKRPVRPAKAHARLPLPRLVELYEEKPEVARLSAKTYGLYCSCLSSIWNKAQRQGYISENLRNPFEGQGVKAKPSVSGKDKQFTLDEANAIFQLPVFTEGERPRQGRGEASFWVPLLLLWTGARPEEIAQLLVSDIFQTKDGTWILKITDEGDHPAKGKQGIKTARSGTGRREFPVPQKLLELGLTKYLQFLKEEKQVALFPLLTVKGSRGYLSDTFGQWWGAYLRHHKVLPAGPGRKPAREFRHYWSTAARQSGLSETAMEYIQGHSTAGKSANVIYGDRSPLGLEISKLQFEGLDLSRVRSWTLPC